MQKHTYVSPNNSVQMCQNNQITRFKKLNQALKFFGSDSCLFSKTIPDWKLLHKRWSHTHQINLTEPNFEIFTFLEPNSNIEDFGGPDPASNFRILRLSSVYISISVAAATQGCEVKKELQDILTPYLFPLLIEFCMVASTMIMAIWEKSRGFIKTES